jgi:phosphate:Na+ symporter
MITELLLLLAGGVGAFLLGMNLMEDGVELMAKERLQRFFAKIEKSRLRSLGFGVVATLVLQSSTAVSLMTLSLVQARLLTLVGALAVVLGANVGTTGTTWLVATLGFQTNLYALSLPIAGMGGLILAFLGRFQGARGLGYLVAGFGLIFLGLDYLKSGMADLQHTVTIPDALHNWGMLYLLGAGILLTMIVQSSSVAMAMALSALHANLITTPEAFAFVAGTNVGTTFTVLLGAIGRSQVKKQVAIAHLLYNLLTAILLFPAIPFLARVMSAWQPEATLSLALFHTLFNVGIVLLFLPFLGKLATRLHKWVPADANPSAPPPPAAA